MSYDWNRELASCYPDYYKWNQWIFLKMYEQGLVYRREAPINWCPGCNTVLANEQVEDGKCWRCDSEIEEKLLEQWFIKITEYADQLLDDLDKLEGKWPEKVRTMQKNWIGRSYGTEIEFNIVEADGSDTGKSVKTFTTRPDTIFGVTYLVLAVDHPLVMELAKDTEHEQKVKDFVHEQKKRSITDRTAEGKEKNGLFIGKYFVNPVNGEKCPIWIADYALMEYGTGAVMAVPAHDQRDFEFAKKYSLPIKVVINPPTWDLYPEQMNQAYVEPGHLVNSGQFNGIFNEDSKEQISKWLEDNSWGTRTVNYKLRDWLISRQRYWGTPIPMVYCPKCGTVPESYENLPVELPDEVDFTVKGNPLATSTSFVNTKCPVCGEASKRETDTMDTFFDSSWYFFRYCSPGYDKAPFDQEQADYWMPVNQYIGGIEHAILHLLYARFFTKVLRDIGLTKSDEPFQKLLTQGMLTMDGAKMSKSKGNVIDPCEMIDSFGSDTVRFFILFAALPEKELDWSDSGVNGIYKFLKRYTALVEETHNPRDSIKDEVIVSKVNRLIKQVTTNMNEYRFNIALKEIMQFVNFLSANLSHVSNETFRMVLTDLNRLLAPFTPHICEEAWQLLGHESFISLETWPIADESKISDSIEAKENLVETVRSDILSVLKLARVENPRKATILVSPQWKHDVFENVKNELESTRNVGEIIPRVMIPEHGTEIAKLVPTLVKDPSKIPQVCLSEEDEFKTLLKNKDLLAEELNLEIELEKASESTEQKSGKAMPGKPAIILN